MRIRNVHLKRRFVCALWLFICLVMAACASSSTVAPLTHATPTVASPAFAAKLQPLLGAKMHQLHIPGAIIYVDIPGQGSWTTAMGTGDLTTHAPLDLNDHYRIGSITKTIVATAVLQLVEAGKLHLDDPIGTYQPEVPNGAHITIRQLLNHTGGIFSYTEDKGFWQTTDTDPTKVWNPRDLLAIAFRHPPYFPPGQSWHYSDTDYILLGMLIEQVTHQRVEEVLQQRVLMPLGMHDTSMPTLTSSAFPEPHPHGYQYGSSERTFTQPPLTGDEAAKANAAAGTPRDVTTLNPSEAWTAGAVISTLHNLQIWAKALATGTLLTALMQHERLSSSVPIDKTGANTYGLGIADVYGLLGHNGGIQGFTSWMLYQPKRQATVVILTNLTAAPDGSDPADQLLGIIYKELFV